MHFKYWTPNQLSRLTYSSLSDGGLLLSVEEVPFNGFSEAASGNKNLWRRKKNNHNFDQISYFTDFFKTRIGTMWLFNGFLLKTTEMLLYWVVGSD